MRGARVLATLVVIAGSLALAPVASATTVTPACTGIQTDLDTMGPGDVIQLPAGNCSVNLTVNSDTAAFTLQGSPSGSSLSPAAATSPIIASNAPVHLTITGVTFTGTTGAPAILLQDPGEAVTITHDTFRANAHPSGFGGAIDIETQFNPAPLASAPTVISNNAFDHNSASSGGAIALLGINPITIAANVFTGNGADQEGGAVIISGVSKPSTSAIAISDNQFGGASAAQGNTSAGVGGAVALAPGEGQSVTVNDNTFEHNAITGSAHSDRAGAGLWVFGQIPTAAPVTQSHNTFTSNLIDAVSATPTPLRIAAGAGEFVLSESVSSSRDTFAGNRVATHDGVEPWGGAVGAYASNGTSPKPGVFVGTDDLFSGNSTAAGGWGGAIYVGGPPAACTSSCPASTLTLNDSTVVGNTVDAGAGSEGGAIWGSPQDHLALRNSIVYGNTPAAEVFGFGTGGPSIQYSDVCGGAGGPAAPASAHDICANPRLDASGLETAASPTLDAGSNALVPAGTATDLAGNARIRRNRAGCFTTPPATVDMGAFEYTGPILQLPCPAPISHVAIGPGPLHLSRGRTSVTLTCQGFGTFCRGTVTLVTVKRFRAADARKRPRKPRVLTLGQAAFNVKVGHRTTVKVKLARLVLARYGRKTTTARVSIGVRNHTSRGALAVNSSRRVTLVLGAPPRRRR